MVLDSIIAFTAIMIILSVVLAAGAYALAKMGVAVVPIFLGMPYIGEVTCQPPTVEEVEEDDSLRPYALFGIPGFASDGCLYLYMQNATMMAIFLGALASVLYIAFANMGSLDKAPAAYMKFFNSIFLIAVLTFAWPGILGLASFAIEHFSVFVASIPWGIGDTYEDQQANAAKTLLFGYKQIRDVLNVDAQCMEPQDPDGNGTVDGYAPNAGCVIEGLIGSGNILMMPFIIFFGNVIGLLLAFLGFVMASIRLLLVHVLALSFPFMLAFSKMPIVGKFFEEWLEAFYGLMLAPIFIAIAAVAGPIAINDILSNLYASGADSEAVRFVAFILWVGNNLTPIAIYVASAKFLGPIFAGAAPIATGALMAGLSVVGGAAKSMAVGVAGMASPRAANAVGSAFSLGLGGGGGGRGGGGAGGLGGSLVNMAAGGGGGGGGSGAAATHPTLSSTIAAIASGSATSLAHGTMQTAATVTPAAVHGGHQIIKATDELPGILAPPSPRVQEPVQIPAASATSSTAKKAKYPIFDYEV